MSWSNRPGLPRQQLLSELSEELPDAVDQFTPDGRLPTEQEASSLLGSTGRARWAAAQSVDLAYKQMEKAMDNQAPDRSQLQQIIAGLSEGVILIEPDHTITYANDAALLMHGVTRPRGAGPDRRRIPPATSCCAIATTTPLVHGQYPIDRVVAGEVVR